MSQWKKRRQRRRKKASKITKDARSLLKICKALLQLYHRHRGARQQCSLQSQGRVPEVLLLPGAGKMQVMTCNFALAAARRNSSCQMRVAISVCGADTEEVTVYLLGPASSLSVLIFTNTAMNIEMFAPCPCKRCSCSVTEHCMTSAN